jgi:acetyl esterase/lipase
MLAAREQGLPLPAAAMPFSPWADMEYSGESLVSNQGKDALFAGKEAIQALAGIILGEGGSRKIRLSARCMPAWRACRRCTSRSAAMSCCSMTAAAWPSMPARRRGCPLDIFGGEEPQHTFQFSAGRAPEATKRSADLPSGYGPDSASPMPPGRPRQPDRRIALVPGEHVAVTGDHPISQ